MIMDDLGKETYLCPKCGSGKIEVDRSGVVIDLQFSTSTTTNCQDCGWKGEAKDLVMKPLGSTIGATDSPEAIVEQMMALLYVNIGKHVAPVLGQLLIQIGFVGHKDQKTLKRLLESGCKSMYESVMKEISSIEEEYQQRPTSID